MIVSSRVSLLVIGQLLKEVVALNIKYNQLKEDLIVKVDNRRVELIETEKIDVFAKYQAPTALEPRIIINIDVLCNYTNNINEWKILI